MRIHISYYLKDCLRKVVSLFKSASVLKLSHTKPLYMETVLNKQRIRTGLIFMSMHFYVFLLWSYVKIVVHHLRVATFGSFVWCVNAFLFITHLVLQAVTWCEKVIVLYEGFRYTLKNLQLTSNESWKISLSLC